MTRRHFAAAVSCKRLLQQIQRRANRRRARSGIQCGCREHDLARAIQLHDFFGGQYARLRQQNFLRVDLGRQGWDQRRCGLRRRGVSVCGSRRRRRLPAAAEAAEAAGLWTAPSDDSV